MPSTDHPRDAHPSRRAFLALLGGSLAIALSPSTGLGASVPDTDDASGADATADTGDRTAAERRYRGTARTVIDAVDSPLGAEQRRTVETTVVVTLGPVSPVGAGDWSGTNPLDFVVEPDPDDAPLAEGVSLVRSAVVAVGDPDDEGGDASPDVQCWDVTRNPTGGFVGVLRDPVDRGASTANVLTSHRALVPGRAESMVMSTEAMIGGTELRAEVSEERVSMRLVGNTTNEFAGDLLDRTRPFSTVIEATRVR